MKSDAAVSSVLHAVALSLLLASVGPLRAAADCFVSPTPPTPQTCDPGGMGSQSEILACNFAGFTYGSFVFVGSGGTTSASSIPRRLVFEGQLSSQISNCDYVDPQNTQQLLFRTSARAVADDTNFEVGVYVQDVVPGSGDPFSQTLESANASVASQIDFGGLQSSQDLDAVIHIDGSFAGLAGRANLQLGVTDFEGRSLGAFFASSKAPPQNGIYWRERTCPDPRNGCVSAFVDHLVPFPGSFDLYLKIPATAGNGIYVELKADAFLDNTASSMDRVSVSFQNTASVELLPPPGVSVGFVSGQSFPAPAGTPFDVSVDIESSGYASQSFSSAGDAVRAVAGTTSDSSAVARGIAGSGRLVSITDGFDVSSAQAWSRLSWQDMISPTGAEQYRFELELVGEAAISDLPPGEYAGLQGESPMKTFYFINANFSGQSTTVIGIYEAKLSGDPCPMGTQPAAGGCFGLSNSDGIPRQIPWEVVGSGDLGDGPVIVAFEPFLPESGSPWSANFSVSARNIFFARTFGGISMGPAQMSIDLGTPGRYVRFLGATGALTGGMPDTDFDVVSATGYDYTQPAPLVQAVPEPSAAHSIVAALGVLSAIRASRRRT